MLLHRQLFLVHITACCWTPGLPESRSQSLGRHAVTQRSTIYRHCHLLLQVRHHHWTGASTHMHKSSTSNINYWVKAPTFDHCRHECVLGQNRNTGLCGYDNIGINKADKRNSTFISRLSYHTSWHHLETCYNAICSIEVKNGRVKA